MVGTEGPGKRGDHTSGFQVSDYATNQELRRWSNDELRVADRWRSDYPDSVVLGTRRFFGSYFTERLYVAPHPQQAVPRLPCQTRFVPHEAHVKSLFKQAPQCLHECLRLPPDAVLSIALPHTGQTF